MDANVNPRTETKPCEVCVDGWVYPAGLPREVCTAPDCTLGRVPVVMPRVPVRAVVSGLTAEQRQAALLDLGEKWAKAEERALAAEQRAAQWESRCHATEAERDGAREQLRIRGIAVTFGMSREAALTAERDEVRRQSLLDLDNERAGARGA
jgi:hypothetical protein